MKYTLTPLLLLIFTIAVHAQSDAFKTYKVVYSQSFSKDKCTNDFEFSDQSKWLISKNGKTGKSLKCLGTGDYQSALEGPSVVAVLRDYLLTDFVVEMDVTQNGKDYSLLDFCIFFGIKDKEHYCYAQIASKADRKSHNIFMVNGDKPKRIGEIKTKGVIWGMKDWQHIRMERTLADKSVKVYYNDELIFETSDELFDQGHIGFGSTRSAIKIDNLKVTAPSFETKEHTFF